MTTIKSIDLAVKTAVFFALCCSFWTLVNIVLTALLS